jgi:catechol-2,3-dioxygenase
MEMKTVILDCKDVEYLSQFYINLLGWTVIYREGDYWLAIKSPDSTVGLAFQKNDDYVPPVWPEKAGNQQMMLHIDFGVKDSIELQKSVDQAVRYGAKIADIQYGGDDWITMIDPVGHPFCFVIWK